MGWLYEFMGVVLGASVFPVALAIMNEKANKNGCITACWVGLASGITAWLVTAGTLNFGVLSIATTYADYRSVFCLISHDPQT